MVETGRLALSIKGILFEEMPFQAEVVPQGPQNIEYGQIKLNEELVHEGFTQYNADTIHEWYAKAEGPTEEIYIGGKLGNGF